MSVIFLYNIDISDLESLKEELQEEYSVSKVTEARWIKSKRDSAKAYLLTFKRESIPAYFKIIGEYAPTKVYDYKAKPLQCAKCQKYGHTLARCNATQHTCRKWCALNHASWECESAEVKCVNCSGCHKSGSIDCPTRKEQEEIMSLQQSRKVGRGRALQLLRQEEDNTNTCKEEKYL